jgi:hypothetical protein
MVNEKTGHSQRTQIAQSFTLTSLRSSPALRFNQFLTNTKSVKSVDKEF